MDLDSKAKMPNTVLGK